MKHKLIQGIILITAIMFSLQTLTLVGAQSNHWLNIVGEIINTNFPQVEAHITATDVDGFPIQGLAPNNFSVAEDGKKVAQVDVAAFMNIEKPLDIALILDTSGSMNTNTTPTAMQNVVNAAKTFVADLTPKDNVAVISFADDVFVVQSLTPDKALVNQALDGLKADKNTALYEGIVKGVDVLKNRPGKRIIVLVTDGTETTPNRLYTLDQATAEAQKQNISIYPIGFGETKKDELKTIAITTKGMSQVEVDSTTLQSVFTKIIQIQRQQYKITYTSAIPSDGKEHTLLVGLDYQDQHDEASRSFTAQLPTTLKLKSPVDGDTIKDSTTPISLDVYALSGVKQIELSIDGQVVAGAFSAEPYDYQWDLSKVPEGSHIINVTLTTNDNSTAKAVANVKVQKPLPPDSNNMLWLVGLVILAVAAVLIPLSIRGRRMRGKAVAQARPVTGAGIPGARPSLLRELEGMNPGQIWPLGNVDVRLGRKREENDIPLQGLNASRRQAVIHFEQGQHILYVLNPTNPAMVNGAPVQSSRVLRPGDTLQLGETILRYEQ
jgi:Ca-activated chloride channel homolog